MNEILVDKQLNIKTVGKREWQEEIIKYHRYEATPYQALKILIDEYPITRDDTIVDFGAGRGRVLIYLNSLTNLKGVGLEINPITYHEGTTNLQQYYLKHPNQNQIEIINVSAEEYKIKTNENIFYFFNPFSLDVFKEVLSNIELSYKLSKRKMTLILFYPDRDFEKYIKQRSLFKFIKEIKVDNALDKNDRFLIYELI